MCGRFTLFIDPADLLDLFPDLILPDNWVPRYNIAPTQPVAVIPNNNPTQVEFFRWGLIPFWAKDPKIGSRMINARAETLAEKPSFRNAYRRRRCLVLADGFYEWRKEPGQGAKTPMYIRLRSGKPFAFAGLWETWQAPDDQAILSCTIVTTEPNALVGEIHNRMPVILDPVVYSLWLDAGEQSPELLNPLLKPYPAEEMIAYPVSRLVNSPANDLPDCVVPVEGV